MRIELCVYIDEMHFSGGARIDVPDCFAKAFKPIKLTDDKFMSYIGVGDEVFDGSFECVSLLKLREDAVEYLSKNLAMMITYEMKKRDTFNGYKVGDNNGK